MIRSKIAFRIGTHNPFAIYAGPVDGPRRGQLERPIGFISDERAAMLAAEAMTAAACLACPWPCAECTLSQATCECYEHQDDHPTDAERLADQQQFEMPRPAPGAHRTVLAKAIRISGPLTGRNSSDLAADLLAILGAQGWRMIHD